MICALCLSETHTAMKIYTCSLLFLSLSTALMAAPNPMATVNWTGNGDGVNWSDPANWDSDPSLPGATDDVVINPAGTNTITVNINADIQSLTLGGTNTLILTSILTLGAASSIGADATFKWQSGTINGPGTLTNEGTIVLDGSTSTKQLNGTIQNNGTLNHILGNFYINENAAFINAGTYDFQTDHDIDSGTVVPGTFTNQATGIIQKTTGSGTSFIDVNLTNQGGTLDVDTGTLQLFRNSIYQGGTYNVANGATLDFDASGGNVHTISGTLSGTVPGIIQLTSTFNVDAAGATLDFGGAGFRWPAGFINGPGTLTNEGTIVLDGSTSTKQLNGTIQNNGTLNHILGNFYINENAAFINADTYDFQTDHDIDSGTVVPGTFTNQATGIIQKTTGSGTSFIDVNLTNQGGTLDVDTGTLQLFRNSIYQGGTYNVANGATLDFDASGGNIHTISGTLSGTVPGTIQLTGTFNVDAAGATLDFGGAGFRWPAGFINGPGTLTNEGTIVLDGSTSTKQLNGTIQNNGTLNHILGNFYINENAAFINAGTYDFQTDHDIDSGTVVPGTFTNQATGIIQKTTGSGASFIDVNLTNAGTIDVQTGTLQFPRILDHQAGATIKGTATVQVNTATLTHSGDTAPGASPGVLTWIGPYAPLATAVFDVEIENTSGAVNGGHDSLRVTGAATLGGTLNVSFAPAYLPAAGDSFTILTASSGVAGTFASVTGPAGVTFDVQVNPNDVVLTVQALTSAALKVFFPGPYNGATMDTDLNAAGVLPLAQPYNTSPYNYAGLEALNAIPADMVDWVLVQLRTGTGAATQVAQRAGLLKADGSITDVNGTPLGFFNSAAGNYFVVVAHRNHLNIMSAAAIAFNDTGPAYDFTTGAAQAFGINPQMDLGGGVFSLWGGDGDRNNDITAFDFLNVWLPENGGPVGYTYGDFNLSGEVTAFDFLNVWLPANGQASQVPN